MDMPLISGYGESRKRKRGPRRRSRKTGGVVKGSTHVMVHRREAVVQLRDAGYSGNNISAALGIPKSTVNRIGSKGKRRQRSSQQEEGVG